MYPQKHKKGSSISGTRRDRLPSHVGFHLLNHFRCPFLFLRSNTTDLNCFFCKNERWILPKEQEMFWRVFWLFPLWNHLGNLNIAELGHLESELHNQNVYCIYAKSMCLPDCLFVNSICFRTFPLCKNFRWSSFFKFFSGLYQNLNVVTVKAAATPFNHHIEIKRSF